MSEPEMPSDEISNDRVDRPVSRGVVLIVDDNPNNLTLLSSILREQGYEVRAANSGRRALQMVERAAPELVLLDVQMPEMDGYAVCRELKANETLRHVPVIFVSALDDVFDKVKGFEAGAVDYVTKKFQAPEVLARVSTQLDLSRLTRELRAQKRALEEANAELTRLSTTDHLTGLANRRKFIHALEAEIAVADRYGTPFTLVMLDVDRFKRVNDTFGHDAGDAVLCQVATLVASSVRASDCVARWGGEEFIILLRRTELTAGRETAEKLRALLEASPVDRVGAVTASFGVTAYRGPETIASISGRVDTLLYEAKAAGRNRLATG